MTANSAAFPAGQQIRTRWGVTFTPWHDPDGRVGFRADRDGLTDVVYLALLADPDDGRGLTVHVCSRPGDADEGYPGAADTTTIRLDIVGPAIAHPWTDGFSVGWRVEGLHHTRYVYLTPSVDGDCDDDAADVHLYVTDSDDPQDATTVRWLPVHERTAASLAAAAPVAGPGVGFDPPAFTDWFRTPDTQQALTGLVTSRYDSGDPQDSAAFRVQALLTCHLPVTAWRLSAEVSDVAIWPTTDPAGNRSGDGGGVLTFRFGGVELSAGHLAAEDLIPHTYIAGNGTVRATALHAAIMALAAVATRINDTVHHVTQVTPQTRGNATGHAAGHTDTNTAGAHARMVAVPATVRPATAVPDDDQQSGLPVSLVTGWATETIHVDPDLEDALVIVTVGDPSGYPVEIVGVDFNAGTVGVWTGQDPDNREWTVVHHLDPGFATPTQAD